jgi:hypothetical protein
MKLSYPFFLELFHLSLIREIRAIRGHSVFAFFLANPPAKTTRQRSFKIIALQTRVFVHKKLVNYFSNYFSCTPVRTAGTNVR